MTITAERADTFRDECEARFAAAGRDRQEVIKVWNDNYDGAKLSQAEAEIVSDCYREALRRTGALVA